MTNKCLDSTQIYNQQQRIKINRIRTSMIATLFLLKISITAISFYWRNDTTTFCNLTEFIRKSISSLRFVSPLPCSSELVRHTLLFVYFFKELISFNGSLDKCHTSVFNALISCRMENKLMQSKQLVVSLGIHHILSDDYNHFCKICL